MTANHPLLLIACVVPLSLAACGGDGTEDEPTVIPEGTHHGYVVSTISVPANENQADQFGLDLGSRTSSTRDGDIDNVLGLTLSGLRTFDFDIQATIDDAVDNGSIILLVDFQTVDFANALASGLGIKFGASPQPRACNSATDATCRRHLTGAATFAIAADSPSNAPVAGPIVNGVFDGGPGNLSLQLALGDGAPISLNLLRARVSASTISDAGIMTANIGGLVTEADLNERIVPAIQVQVQAVVERDCAGGAAPECGCIPTSTGALIVRLDSNADCAVSVAELVGFPLVASLLQPDTCSKRSCTRPDALSIGVKVQAVKAAFPL